MFRERASNLKALGEAFRPLVVPAAELSYVEKDTAKHFTDAGKAHLQALSAVFAACEPFTAEALEAALNAYVADNGLKFKEVAPPLRTALMRFLLHGILNAPSKFWQRRCSQSQLFLCFPTAWSGQKKPSPVFPTILFTWMPTTTTMSQGIFF